MYKITSSLLFVLFTTFAFCQELYMPRNIVQAYENNTRSLDGKPGKNYWQNSGDYKIAFHVDPVTKIVSGTENIVYENNSPDALKSIVIKFVNNVHKPTSPRAAKASADFLSKGLSVKSLSINGKSYEVDSEDWETFYELPLSAVILPKSKNIIKIEWDFPLSKESGREGQVDENTFFVAYAYPRIAVYDDYNGWDKLPHNGRQEFYNNFNNYDVSITVAKNYVVYATGVLQNPEEVLQPNVLNKFRSSLTSDQLIHVATKEEIENNKVTKQEAFNTWKFKADHITDFTFGLSSTYVWDASSVQLKSKRVSTQATYNAGTADFEKYVDWERYSIKWFSENWPGIEYPFPTMIGFQGFADMEYPMMVNDTAIPDNFEDSRQTVDHEIAHTYFPFMMGTNETRYAFMDEGWVTAFEYLIGEAENGKEFNDKMYTDFRVKRYINDRSAEQDQPIISMSSQLSGIGYGSNAYIKPAFAYLALKDMLGDDLFKKTLHHYMDTWSGKHPTPWDFFYSMNLGSGQNLNWFWNNWFFTNNYIDLKVTALNDVGDKVSVVIENVGGFAIPFEMEVTYQNGKVTKKHFTPNVWKNGNHYQPEMELSDKVKSVKINGGIFMDYTPADNFCEL
ncbi:M1 family metallopeptidase [Chryseobacterium sp. SNU WT5]|uniref:M1 family metallopeptidase n=1 Tax=Chryseobacterium sp. SNU WT5 TaxID=2594269 RepID=UPI00117EA777|nr:M1 family metallopeptidase [Chryseobacterium sp. SNU WT5]QDP86533.1 M1 family metallopeptidase [Chryseobacterium sp. SNU WT5]